MSNAAMKPWFQVDDDAEEPLAATVVVDDEPAPANDGGAPSVAPDGAMAKLSGKIARVRVASSWAIAPLGVAAGWLLWIGPVSGARADSTSWTHTLVLLAMIALAGGIVLISTAARRNAANELLNALQRSSAGGALVRNAIHSGGELQPIWQGIEEHSANIEERTADLLEAHQQIGLELKLADAQVKQASAVFGAIADAVLVIDPFDRLIQANAAAETLFAFSCREMLRKHIGQVISDERLLRLIRQAREADLRAAERRAEHEIGEQIYGTTIVPLTFDHESGDEHETGHGVVVVLRDITQERDVSKKKSEFVAHVVHELRTPLSSIRAYVEMLVDGEADDEQTRAEFHGIIQTSADRLGRLIDNMLNISRIEAGTVRINKEPIGVSIVVKEAVDMIRPQAEEKNITLTAHLTPVAFRVMADRDLIYQAVLNLVSNAIKYTPDGGQVTVRMTPHEENRRMVIEVEDTGVGIPKEDLPKMFEKFYRVEANKKVAKGTGLGLNLVKKVVEQVHEGEITLKSEVGKGSTFGMILPMMS